MDMGTAGLVIPDCPQLFSVPFSGMLVGVPGTAGAETEYQPTILLAKGISKNADSCQ